MSALVAYDDSDDSDEPEKIQDCVMPRKEVSAESLMAPFMASIPQYDVNMPIPWKKDSPRDGGGLSFMCTYESTVDRNEPISQNTGHSLPCSPVNDMRTSEKTFNKSSAYAQKRPTDTPCSERMVKPYIPKRMKQEHSSCSEDSGGAGIPKQAFMSTSVSSRNIFRVSDYLRPYLHSKYSSTEIPHKLVFLMNEHNGPVNRVQWNPVKQYSHLLLSASMDTTVKVWDAVDCGKCLSVISSHSKAARDAQWSECGQKILSGGFDSMLYLTDVETGKQLYKARNDFKISVVRFQPNEPNIFLCGGFSPALKAWDCRLDKPIQTYRAAVQQHFEVLFLRGGKEFLSTTDSVSRDSADRTIIAWDFGTAAKISNQIFDERYTCPSLALHPKENTFIAQTNGNYIALFSAQRPYKMNKKKRFEGHKVEGFAVGCEFSPDGSLIVTGSSEGNISLYNYHTARALRCIPGDGGACISVTFHPVLPSLLASSYWDGQIRVWQ